MSHSECLLGDVPGPDSEGGLLGTSMHSEGTGDGRPSPTRPRLIRDQGTSTQSSRWNVMVTAVQSQCSETRIVESCPSEPEGLGSRESDTVEHVGPLGPPTSLSPLSGVGDPSSNVYDGTGCVRTTKFPE